MTRCGWRVFIALMVGSQAVVATEPTPAPTPPSTEARHWLQRMADANKTLDYEGVMVYAQGLHLEALHLTHTIDATGERQHIASLSGPKREVVITHLSATCTVVEKTHAPRCPPNRYKRSSSLLTGPRDLTRLEQHYTLTVLGTDHVAGQETVRIAIQPRDHVRFGYQLWLDQQTGILLRSMLLDETESVVEQMMFTHVQITRRVPPPTVPPDPTTATQARSPSSWNMVYLPAGFEPIRHNHFTATRASNPSAAHQDASAERMTEHLLFSDGLVNLSVFLEPLAGAEPFLEGLSRMGAMNAFGAVVADHQVVVVGEVPQDTVQRIAQSIRYVEPSVPATDKPALDKPALDKPVQDKPALKEQP